MNTGSLRIAIHLPSFLPKASGAEIFHHQLACELTGLGHSVTLIVPRSFVRRIESTRYALPYAMEGYPGNLWSWFKRSKNLALFLNRSALGRLQSRLRFDVWHTAFFSPPGVCFADWQSRGGPPGLVRAVGDDALTAPGLDSGPLPRQWILEQVRRAKCVVALSEEMRGALLDAGFAADRVRVFPNAVRVDLFPPACAEEKAALRTRAGLPGSGPLLLAVGRNHPQKDYPTLLAAFNELLLTRPDASLVIAGRDVPALREMADSMGTGAKVFLFECAPGWVPGTPPRLPPPELVDLYRAADVFVMSSLLEGFSTALLEAMATGLSVAATDAPGIRNQVRHGQTGFLSPVRDAAALAESLRILLENPEVRTRMGAAGLAEAAEFSWEKLAGRYAGLYRELIQSR